MYMHMLHAYTVYVYTCAYTEKHKDKQINRQSFGERVPLIIACMGSGGG